jgi:hypothetical protein
MEERVRVCRECHAIVGWFAIFCETCGAKQDPHTGGASPTPAAAGAAGAAKAVAPGAPPPAAPRSALEDGIRTHMAPATEARSVARELFQTQLRLIHKHREGVVALERDVLAIKHALAAAERAGPRDAVRRGLDDVSERVYEAEQKWGELQVAYNRESEIIEEESRENMEAADFDAYLSPDENEKVEAEFATLREQFDGIDSGLRDLGRDLARARQEAESRYLGVGGKGGSPPWWLLAVTVALMGWSGYALFFQYGDDPMKIAATAGPLVLALGLWITLGFSRPRA